MENQINKLCDKIDMLIAIISIQNKDVEEQVRILKVLDYKIPKIASLLGISTRTVDNKIAELKRKGKLK